MDFRKLFFAQLFSMLIILVVFAVYQWHNKTVLLRNFTVTNEKMIKDLEGRQVQISHGQVWPFDIGQNLTLSVLHKKQVENFVVIVADVTAVATVEQVKDKKLPSRISVSGHLKLTYELFNFDWYLVSVDALTAKASPQFD